MVLQALIVGFAAAPTPSRSRLRPPPAPPSPAYGGPLRLAALVLVSTYVLAGVAKLRRAASAGCSATPSATMSPPPPCGRTSSARPSSPIGTWLVQHAWLFPPLALATLVLELGAPVALFGGRPHDVGRGYVADARGDRAP